MKVMDSKITKSNTKTNGDTDHSSFSFSKNESQSSSSSSLHSLQMLQDGLDPAVYTNSLFRANNYPSLLHFPVNHHLPHIHQSLGLSLNTSTAESSSSTISAFNEADSTTWWNIASQLALQDYFSRLSAISHSSENSFRNSMEWLAAQQAYSNGNFWDIHKNSIFNAGMLNSQKDDFPKKRKVDSNVSVGSSHLVSNLLLDTFAKQEEKYALTDSGKGNHFPANKASNVNKLFGKKSQNQSINHGNSTQRLWSPITETDNLTPLNLSMKCLKNSKQTDEISDKRTNLEFAKNSQEIDSKNNCNPGKSSSLVIKHTSNKHENINNLKDMSFKDEINASANNEVSHTKNILPVAANIKLFEKFYDPKKNAVHSKKSTVASLLAKSRQSESKSENSLPVSPQISLLKHKDLKNATSNSDFITPVLKPVSLIKNHNIASEWDSGSDSHASADEDNQNIHHSVFNIFPPVRKRRRVIRNMKDLQIPLQQNWKRETLVRIFSPCGPRGHVVYFAPCGKKLRHYPEVMRYLDRKQISNLTRDNFSFSTKVMLGDFVVSDGVKGFLRLNATQAWHEVEKARLAKAYRNEGVKNRVVSSLNETRKHLLPKSLSLQTMNDSLLHEELLSKQRKQSDECINESSLINNDGFHKQQKIGSWFPTSVVSDQLYHVGFGHSTEMLLNTEVEKERKRQHTVIVRALEARKRYEERERKKLIQKAEKLADREKRSKLKLQEQLIIRESRKPAEDLELSDMESLPSLSTLQKALLNDEQAEEELLSVMMHLMVCAIEDPGIPHPGRHTTLLGQTLRQADITATSLSEVLRIYLRAHAIENVLSSLGACGEYKKDMQMEKTAIFQQRLQNHPVFQMATWLQDQPFFSLSAVQKASILAYVCNELLCNKAVLKQLDSCMEEFAQLRKCKWQLESRLRRFGIALEQSSSSKEEAVADKSDELLGNGKKIGDDDDDDDDPTDSESESCSALHEVEIPDEEANGCTSREDLEQEIEKLKTQKENLKQEFLIKAGQLRALHLGQDRYYRNYWILPSAGGIFVESLSPELITDNLMSLEKDELVNCESVEINQNDIRKKIEETVENGISSKNQNNSMSTCINNINVDNFLIEDDIKMEIEKSTEQLNNNDAEISYTENNTNLSSSLHSKQWFSILSKHLCSPKVLDDLCKENSSYSSSTTSTLFYSESCLNNIASYNKSDSSLNDESVSLNFPDMRVNRSIILQKLRLYPKAKNIPPGFKHGWWQMSSWLEVENMLPYLHTRGVRERELKKWLEKNKDVSENAFRKALHHCLLPVNNYEVKYLSCGAVDPESGKICSRDSALRFDLKILEQVELLEEKICTASMQIKGWKGSGRKSVEDISLFHPAYESKSCDDSIINLLEVAKEKLLELEKAIERRYFREPLRGKDTNLNVLVSETGNEVEPSRGLLVWREAVQRCCTSSQLASCISMLEISIAWDKSIMKASCQFCHCGDNEDMLLLCDGCDKGYHTYCFRPKMTVIPEGDWFCYECLNAATGQRCCLVCGSNSNRGLCVCDQCPRAFHVECLQPPLSRVPRGKWLCNDCTRNNKKKQKKQRCNNQCSSDSLVTDSIEDIKKKRNSKCVFKDMEMCFVALSDLEGHDDAWPFMLPVNTKQFPTYRKVIKTPMDLSSLRRKLQEGRYKNQDEFAADVRQIFKNCEIFNEDNSPVGKAGHNMQSFFEIRWAEYTNSACSFPSDLT